MTLSEKIDRIVDRDIVYCASELIWELRRVSETLSDYDEYMNLVRGRADFQSAAEYEGWFEHEGRIIKKDEAWDSDVINTLESWGYKAVTDESAEDCEVTVITDPEGCVRISVEGDEDDAWTQFEKEYPAAWGQARNHYEIASAEEAEDWEEACSMSGADPDYDEPMEHWIVTDWLGNKLIAKGEVVEEFLGLTIWARCTTGQSIKLDCVIQEIAKECL